MSTPTDNICGAGAESSLATDVSASAGVLAIQAKDATLFAFAKGQAVELEISQRGQTEIVRFTGTGGAANVLYVSRGQAGTTKKAFTAGACVKFKWTCANIDAYISARLANANSVTEIGSCSGTTSCAPAVAGANPSKQGTSAAYVEDKVSTAERNLQEQIDAIVAQIASTNTACDTVPVGAIFMTAGVLPDGYLVCDGQAVSRTQYEQLFSAFGTTFGVGNGSTTFNLPDFQGRVPVGAGSGAGLSSRPLGSAFGTETHSLTAAELAPHTHDVTFDRQDVNGGDQPNGAYDGTDHGAIAQNISRTTTSTGSGQGFSVVQPGVAVKFVVKAKKLC